MKIRSTCHPTLLFQRDTDKTPPTRCRHFSQLLLILSNDVELKPWTGEIFLP
ncbi:hypothetical protein DPMN_033824 [Dreissena polymorpha]|uniref:Uncharacterized protein n=1 Tax=Dreissena polymorpha TaxID=45954 RepID=A0A9D4M6R7_DREPO|nr:hypothetical protein DPMN_033824 [Dreissena polymorpha]